MRTGGNAVRLSAGGAAVLAALLAPGCDVSWNFRAKGDNVVVEGQSGGAAASARALSLEVDGDRALTTRPGGEVVLRFTRELDPSTARGAVRVEDETRGLSPVPVEVETRGRELVLRARDAAGWRPGSVLAVRVAGLPSLGAPGTAEGNALPADAAVRVQVRAPRPPARVAPFLVSSEPADGAAAVDPVAAVVLRFSEPMDARALNGGSRDPRRAPLALTADGADLPYRCFLDRERRELTVLPESPFPAGSEVVLLLAARVRDAGGNGLARSSPRRVAFTVAVDAPSGGAGRLVEAFEDRERLDPLGTTVRWNDPAEPGVLSGILEPRVLPIGGGGEFGAGGDAAILLDPRGGSFRMLVTAAELGDEARVLKGLLLASAPGGLPGELLEPRVRVAPLPALLLAGAGDDDAPWQGVTEGLRGASPRGADGVLALPFRHPVAVCGAEGILVEVSWAGVAGTMILRAARHEEPRCLLYGPGPDPAVLRTAPVLGLEAVGDRAAARSAWMDAGVPAPSWQEPRVRPAAYPARAAIQLQGAPALPDGSGPDASRATGWTADPTALDGLRWIRFRVLFSEGGPGAPAASVDEIALPFVGR